MPLKKNKKPKKKQAKKRFLSTNNSKENAVVLNEDICTEILLRLPVKSVTKFQLVCRRWLSITSTNHFRRLHTLRRHKPPLSLILNPRDSRFLYLNPINPTAKPTPFSIKLANNPKYVTIVSSCNGLLLLKSRGDTNGDDLFVYNPITRQSTTVLCLSHTDTFIHVKQLHLVFDPTVSIHYKIVCVRKGKINTRIVGQIEIFDSKSGTWNVCGDPGYVPCAYDYELNSGSALHYRNKIYSTTTYNRVYSFDLDSCKDCSLGTPTLPYHQYIHYDSDENLLHVSNDGCLYYVSLLSDGNGGQSVAIWTLKDNKFSQWLLKYNHRLSRELLRGRPSRPFRFIAETSTLLIDVQGKIVAYCFLDKSHRDFLDLKKESYWDYFHMHSNYSKYIHNFGQTLAPL